MPASADQCSRQSSAAGDCPGGMATGQAIRSGAQPVPGGLGQPGKVDDGTEHVPDSRQSLGPVPCAETKWGRFPAVSGSQRVLGRAGRRPLDFFSLRGDMPCWSVSARRCWLPSRPPCGSSSRGVIKVSHQAPSGRRAAVLVPRWRTILTRLRGILEMLAAIGIGIGSVLGIPRAEPQCRVIRRGRSAGSSRRWRCGRPWNRCVRDCGRCGLCWPSSASPWPCSTSASAEPCPSQPRAAEAVSFRSSRRSARSSMSSSPGAAPGRCRRALLRPDCPREDPTPALRPSPPLTSAPRPGPPPSATQTRCPPPGYPQGEPSGYGIVTGPGPLTPRPGEPTARSRRMAASPRRRSWPPEPSPECWPPRSATCHR